MDVQSIIDSTEGQHGQLCEKVHTFGTETISWNCGILKVDTAAFGLSIFSPVNPAPDFTPGWCTVHVVQYQRNEYGVGADFVFDVIIYDHVKKVIRVTQQAPIVANSKTLSIKTRLAWTIEVEVKGGDNNLVIFSWSGVEWSGFKPLEYLG
jgi:hypothetical protein